MLLKPINLITIALYSGVLLIFNFHEADGDKNISCYQCTRQANIECEPHELKPCPTSSDRCVTHIVKDRREGYKISRECGQAPCSFDDDMTTKALGLDKCDRTANGYFCLFCCSESGCNKDNAAVLQPNHLNHFLCILLLLLFIRI